ncbi:MAG: hypothetical protein HN742_08890 [Lentisphaerae bacterium]|jgi:hypothetical protein|nr:hypothetical protein [Lentisphaerota bacterium]MBT5611159.1 hypothetical protein [Lentisphaerota bacterium]MBT7054717.1 hypothetical protein [Lentisphaerota bacterium]MBT7841975.1 hypothetical protein [Lentisphaerota bacterium]
MAPTLPFPTCAGARVSRFHALLPLGLGLCLMPSPGAAAADPDALQALRAQRREATHRRRRIIFNNDADDALILPTSSPATAENLLKLRTTALAGTQVDTIFYCSLQGDMSLHRTKVGETLMGNASDYYTDGSRGKYFATRRNVVPELIAQGTDPLQVMVDFCRGHGLEVFCTMRMNDTHDSVDSPNKPFFGFSRFKREHPECLMGSFEKRPKFKAWTGVDYKRPAVRERVFQRLEEVCRNYDLDGIELDFLRHECLFKSVAWGGNASQEERDLLTDLIRRIRDMTEREGLRQGHPILVAIRVPDSVEYCKELGLDLAQWFKDGLVDLLTGTCMVQLNDWDTLVQFGHHHGVPVYAGLSDTWEKFVAPPFKRQSVEAYRGRAMAAWQAGVDGIYLFNFFNPTKPQWRELGDPAGLARMDKLYFLSPLSDHMGPSAPIAPGRPHRRAPLLTPQNPWRLLAGQPVQTQLRIGDDVGETTRAGLKPAVTCYLRLKEPFPVGQLEVRLNGTPLSPDDSKGAWLGFNVPPSAVKAGLNDIRVTPLSGKRSAPDPGRDTWDVSYEGTKRLRGAAQWPWRRLSGGAKYVEEIRDAALYFADDGTGADDFPSLVYPWMLSREEETTVEARVKVVSSTDPLAACLRLSDGTAVEYLTLMPDRIGLKFAGLSCPFDSAGAFHTYRVVFQGQNIRVYVDGVLRLDGTGQYTTSAKDEAHWVSFWSGLGSWNACSLLFGSASGPGTGAALWEFVRFRSSTDPIILQDLMVAITYPPARPTPAK